MPFNKKNWREIETLMEIASFESNPLMVLYKNFNYKTELGKKLSNTRFIDLLDRFVVNLHFFVFKSWIRKKLREYYYFNKKLNFSIPLFNNNGKTKEWEYLERNFGSFYSFVLVRSLAN